VVPGIAAIMDSDGDGSGIDSMLRSMTHKKWQKTDLFVRPPLAVGRVHLGVVNPESQPIFNEDGSIYIVMDGEVFDYEEEKGRLLSNGHRFRVGNDPEFCLHLYEELGEEFAEKLNGCFVIIIHDTRNDRILITNDRHGLIPLYYARIDDKSIFASEVKAILTDKEFKKKINHEAVADFFAFGKLIGDKTFFKGIEVTPPASTITWSQGSISRRKYWDFEFREEYDANLTEEYYLNTLAILFRKSMERRTRSKHHYGVFLSGGLDSRMVIGAFDRKCYPVSTFTFGIKGSDEVKIAQKISDELRTSHTSVELKDDYLVRFAEEGIYQTDGMLDCVNFHWISFLEAVRKEADIMFHGLGLDLLLSNVLTRATFATFAGSGSGILVERQITEANESVYADLLFRYLNQVIPESVMPAFFSKDYYKLIKKYPHQSLESYLSQMKEKDPIKKANSVWLRMFGRYYLSRVFLRNYCEDRVPSLDNDFFDFVLRVPTRLIAKNSFSRYQELGFKLMGKLSPTLAKIPYQRTGVAPTMPMLAHRIGFLLKGGYKFMARKLKTKTRGFISLPDKIGYPDYGQWIRENKNMRTYFESILLDKRTLERGYFNASFIAQMVSDHMKGTKNWGTQLCALLTFELWHRLFFDESQGPISRGN